ncbi:hypothetical protein [Maribacter sp. ACAM166]|uniref:hypothetical protein n=1 Tax=Maribacter sp. ACAM166 TaxID=2508996 RepID=UPI0010FF136B|nr:hypothetical protein [Maribacter sp. ACAM166]TLP81740.1 hypothetical protein ES765_03380 [Maribacter sp. ACAM166]
MNSKTLENKTNWQILTDIPRFDSIEKLKSCIDNCGGYIVNHTMFSDIAISLTVEIEEKDIQELYENLITDFKIIGKIPESLNQKSNRDWWILINMSFVKGKGNLKREVPNC